MNALPTDGLVLQVASKKRKKNAQKDHRFVPYARRAP
jgi:hypothetical protein